MVHEKWRPIEKCFTIAVPSTKTQLDIALVNNPLGTDCKGAEQRNGHNILSTLEVIPIAQ